MMETDKSPPLTEKPSLHPRNKHRGRYEFDQLITAHPLLAKFVKPNAYQDLSIDFANPLAVKALNQALLKHYYAISEWDIPPQYLCPPIPGRADYLHYVADLLGAGNNSNIPHGANIRVLDIGVGANVIYPLIGQHEYGWQFVGVDIDPLAIANGERILAANPHLKESIELRLQTSPSSVFQGVIKAGETIDLTICNPPFHASLQAANAGTRRKWQGLEKSKGSMAANLPNKIDTLNFGGQSNELYCAGGEKAFVNRMIKESSRMAQQCLWFTTLISKEANLPDVYRALKNVNAAQIETLNMAQGQKKSRVVAWTFFNAIQQKSWHSKHWK
jgi:23S rRNA (adenine1618-N6)-methyltransferase